MRSRLLIHPFLMFEKSSKYINLNASSLWRVKSKRLFYHDDMTMDDKKVRQ